MAFALLNSLSLPTRPKCRRQTAGVTCATGTCSVAMQPSIEAHRATEAERRGETLPGHGADDFQTRAGWCVAPDDVGEESRRDHALGALPDGGNVAGRNELAHRIDDGPTAFNAWIDAKDVGAHCCSLTDV